MTKPFAGRIVFDHLPKTAGQAVVTWLQDALGDGVVMPYAKWMTHKNCITKYGGIYSIVGGHLSYSGESLDARYSYVTLLREPLSRCISALTFHVNNFKPSDLPAGLWQASYDFLINEGDVGDAALKNLEVFLQNGYVNHFANIATSSILSGEDALQHSIDVVKNFFLYGFYDNLPPFLNDLSGLIGGGGASKLPIVNETKKNPAIDFKITNKLLNKLRQLNSLDIRFYEALLSIYSPKRADWHNIDALQKSYVKFESTKKSDYKTDVLKTYKVNRVEQDIYRKDDFVELSISLKFNIDVSVLQFIMHVFDDTDVLIFQGHSDNFDFNIKPDAVNTGDYVLNIRFQPVLPDGFYFINIDVIANFELVLMIPRFFQFQVIRDRPPYFEGSVFLAVSSELTRDG